MNQYKFRYKRGWFWKTIRARGHNLDKELDRMDVFGLDGSIISIPEWSKCYLKLGIDWIAFTKGQMEAESGQDIKLKV
jgi:hypothetical protein